MGSPVYFLQCGSYLIFIIIIRIPALSQNAMKRNVTSWRSTLHMSPTKDRMDSAIVKAVCQPSVFVPMARNSMPLWEYAKSLW